MGQGFYSSLSRPPSWLLAFIVALGVVGALVFAGYQFSWTGFASTVTKETTRTTEDGKQEITVETQHEKRLWEWLGLAGVLAVPVVLSLGGLWYNHRQNKREQDRIEAEKQREELAANQRAQDAALQAYLDQMSDLIVDRGLRDQPKASDVHKIAQARTIAILLGMDESRKRRPLKLVYELRLINKDDPLIRLTNAGLDNAILKEATFHDACLRRVDLRCADLEGADLKGSDLSYADLRGANLKDANLAGVSLKAANLLPYDKKNPARLSASHLNDTGVNGFDLERDDLKQCNLEGADLSGADLSGALLGGVDLRGTKGLTQRQLEQAIGDQTTRLPDQGGLYTPDAWSEMSLEEQIEQAAFQPHEAYEPRPNGQTNGQQMDSRKSIVIWRPTGNPRLALTLLKALGARAAKQLRIIGSN